MCTSLVKLRSFRAIWLVFSIILTLIGFSLQYSSTSRLPFIQPTLDGCIAPQEWVDDFEWPEFRNNKNQDWPRESLCPSRNVFGDLLADKVQVKTHAAKKPWKWLDNELEEDQDTELFRRIPGISDVASLASERTGSTGTGPTTKIYIVPYYRGRLLDNTFLPFHWAIFLTPAPNAFGTAYQLRGTPGSFVYPGPERAFIMARSSLKRQELLVGRIPNTQIREMENVIARVPISKSPEGYNCQTWTETVLQHLNQRGWLSQQPSAIVSSLKRQEIALPATRTSQC